MANITIIQRNPNPDKRAFYMASMNVSLPEGMKNWVEEQAHSAYYSNSSDYIRDLIRRDQQSRLANFQSLIIYGVDSGKGTRTMSDLRAAAKAKLGS